MRWVRASDYGFPGDRLIDPAPLVRLVDAWSGSGSGGDRPEAVARVMVQDSSHGPVHLVRLIAAMEVSARSTGGTLTHITDTPAVTDVCGGALHHLVEVLLASGLREATAAAGRLDAETRLLVVEALRPYWQAPLRALSEPLQDGRLLLPSRDLWRR